MPILKNKITFLVQRDGISQRYQACDCHNANKFIHCRLQTGQTNLTKVGFSCNASLDGRVCTLYVCFISELLERGLKGF